MEEKNEQSLSNDIANTGKEAAKAVLGLAKAGVKAATGNVVGAAVDVVKNPKLLRAVIAAVLAVVLMLSMCLLLFGAAIIAVINAFIKLVEESWNEQWEEEGISSGGSVLYLYSVGLLKAGVGTIGSVADKLLSSDEGASNSAVDSNSVTYTEKDYDNAIASIHDQKALAGRNSVLHKHLNMIQLRVEQRGQQMISCVTGQYALNSIGLAIGNYLQAMISHPILFNGVDMDESTVNIDQSAFQITDIQALKILAAYSVQNDCNLENIDIWDLMDYCGWYGISFDDFDSATIPDGNIYEAGSCSQSFDQEIASVVYPGQLLPTEVYTLHAPLVPQWSGSFAPQWYYEELDQIRQMNAEYERMLLSNPEAADEMLHFDILYGDILKGQFRKLREFQPYGLIDSMYTNAAASMQISRTEYHGITEDMQEAIAEFAGNTLVGRVWADIFQDESITTSDSGTVKRLYKMGDFSNEAYHEYWSSREPLDGTDDYYLVELDEINKHIGQDAMDKIDAPLFFKMDSMMNDISSDLLGNETVYFDELDSSTTYVLYREWDSPLGDQYFLKCDLFTTLPEPDDYEAFELIIKVDIAFTPVSIDTLITDIIGLWPGDLDDTEVYLNRTYAKGHAGDPLYLRSWTETYTDLQGHTFQFEVARQQGYQVEGYQDMVLALGALLGINTAGLYQPDYGYGGNVVSVAMREYEWYQANGLSGGDMYWDAMYDIKGQYRWHGQGWCLAFVWYCFYECGYIGPNGCFGDWEKWEFWPGAVVEYIVEPGYGELYTTNDYKPVPGDLIFLDDEIGDCDFGTNHIGIVKEVTPDGKIVTIEGNAGNSLKIKTYNSYEVGTVCYTLVNTDTGIREPIYISSYVHPFYPTASSLDPLYAHVTSEASPEFGWKQIGTADPYTQFGGMGRFRISQMSGVLDFLEKKYPQLYSEEMRQSLDSQDIAAFSSHWNTIMTMAEPLLVRTAQMEYVNNYIAQPIFTALRESEFSWSFSYTRRELVLALATTTDKPDEVVAALNELSQNLSNDMTDEELISVLCEGDFLRSVLMSRKEQLWPQDSDYVRQIWIDTTATLLDASLRWKNEAITGNGGYGSIGDMISSGVNSLFGNTGGFFDELFGSSAKYEAFRQDTVFWNDYISGEGTMPYAIYGPSTAEDYNSVPLIIWLHGSGSVGSTKNYLMQESHFPSLMANWPYMGFNAFVVAPHMTGSYNFGTWDNPESEKAVREIVSKVCREYNIDKKRIVIMGHSLGGQGVIYMASKCGDIFKKAITMSPYYASASIRNIKIPILCIAGYASMGEHAPPVRIAENDFPAVFGKETVYRVNAGHSVPKPAMAIDNDGDKCPDFLEWLLDFENDYYP